MHEPYLRLLDGTIRKSCSPGGGEWLDHAYHQLEKSDDPGSDLSLLCARALRKLGRKALGESTAAIETEAGPLPIDRWPAGNAGRVALILKAIHAYPSQGKSLVETVYRQGDEVERATVIRGLALFSPDDALKHLALETSRVNSVVLYSGLASYNPYPAAHFSDAEFDHMILKALFIGVKIDTVVGLDKRANRELSRMCEDYIEERVAAGRSIPADIWLALGPYAGPGGESLLLEHLAHPEPEHRYYATIATGRRQKDHPRLRDALRERERAETDQRVLGVLKQALIVAPQ